MDANIKAILKKIKDYKEIVIARHIGPDPDAVASQIALRDAIKLKYPDKLVYAVGAPVAKYKYIGKLDKIEENKLNNPLLIVLDCPNIIRVDGVNFDNYREVIKIDHHPLEDKMGASEWIDETSTSTCEMIAELLIRGHFKIDASIAENLYIGVVSDSDRFLYGTTSSKTFEIMSILLKTPKIDLPSAYAKLYVRPLNEVKFQSYIAEHLKITKNGFAYLKIDKKIIDKYEVDAGTASNLVNNFNNIKEIICWALVSYDEKQELYKVNIRSRGPIINEVASHYNGGGHAMASGARIKDIKQVDELFKQLDEECKKYNENLK